jgi:hypothetical protein
MTHTKESILAFMDSTDIKVKADGTTYIVGEEMVKRSLLRLYSEQTEAEQNAGHTSEDNGFGFNGVDGEFMSSVAKWYGEKGYASPKQMAWVSKKIRKYAGQLAKLANQDSK